MQNQENDRIKFDVAYAITLTSLRPRYRDRSSNDVEGLHAAQKIVDHLKQCGWRFERETPTLNSFHHIGGEKKSEE